jgi:tetratricopeptide (TPR) repeat protein
MLADTLPASPASLNARGLSLHARGQGAAALACFDAALALDPCLTEALNNRAVVRQAQGNLLGALADLEAALALRPGYADALNNRGLARQERGDLRGALEDFSAALVSAPPDRGGAYHHNRGVVRHAQGDLSGALEDFNAALALAPTQPWAHGKRALVHRDRGDLSAALADLDEALGQAPDDLAGGLHHARGGVRILLGDVAGAIADYDEALRLDPLCCIAYVSRGNARYHRRDRGAGRDYLTAFRLDATRSVGEMLRLLLADAHKDAASVLDHCRRHLEFDPADEVARGRRACTLLLLGREEEAEQDIAQVVQLRALVPGMREAIALARQEKMGWAA